MGRPLGVPTAAITEDSALGGTDIQRSLRFRSNNSAYLARTFGTNSSDTTKTISFWIKRGKTGSYQIPFGTTVSGNIEGYIRFNDDDTLQLEDRNASDGTSDCRRITTEKIRDVTAWYHIVLALDSTQGTEADRAKFYINGTQSTISSSITITQNYSFQFFRSSAINFIGVNGNNSNYFDGYLTDINFVDGQALDASYFGYTDFQTGQWRSKKFEGTYGNNGFYLKFADNSGTSSTTLGKDSSGNGNNWTPSNVSVTSGDVSNDSVLDTPTNNFANLNNLNFFMIDLGSTVNQLEEGGLFVDNPNNADRAVHATQLMQKGKKYYVEGVYYEAGSGSQSNWAITSLTKNDGYPYKPNSDRDEGAWGIDWRGGAGTPAIFYKNGGQTYSGSRPSNGQVIGMAIDLVNGKIWFHKAGTYAWGGGNPANGTTPDISGVPTDEDFFFTVSIDSGGPVYTDFRINFGQQPFQYKPSGFDGLLNSETITVTPPVIMRPPRHSDTLLYTATGNAMTVTGLEFKPDFIWQKRRDATSGSHFHYWFNSVVGGRYGLQSNTTGAEFDTSNASNIVFNDDGFNMAASDGGQGNAASGTYAAWCWKAGGSSNTFNVDGTGYGTASAAGITDGNVAITGASVNTKNGFSIVTYTGSTASGVLTVGHGLGKKPAWVIVKRRDATSDWIIGHKGLATTDAFSNNKFLKFTNETIFTNSLVWGAEPTTTVTQIVSDGNAGASNLTSSGTYVMYSWAEIPGYSSFGRYKGNGGSVGTYVHCGFRPAVVIVKNLNTVKHWGMYDNKRAGYNVANYALFPSDYNAEDTSEYIDFLANGFKLRSSALFQNKSGDIFIYAAFAEQSGQTPYDTFPNAR